MIPYWDTARYDQYTPHFLLGKKKIEILKLTGVSHPLHSDGFGHLSTLSSWGGAAYMGSGVVWKISLKLFHYFYIETPTLCRNTEFSGPKPRDSGNTLARVNISAGFQNKTICARDKTIQNKRHHQFPKWNEKVSSVVVLTC